MWIRISQKFVSRGSIDNKSTLDYEIPEPALTNAYEAIYGFIRPKSNVVYVFQAEV